MHMLVSAYLWTVEVLETLENNALDVKLFPLHAVINPFSTKAEVKNSDSITWFQLAVQHPNPIKDSAATDSLLQ